MLCPSVFWGFLAFLNHRNNLVRTKASAATMWSQLNICLLFTDLWFNHSMTFVRLWSDLYVSVFPFYPFFFRWRQRNKTTRNVVFFISSISSSIHVHYICFLTGNKSGIIPTWIRDWHMGVSRPCFCRCVLTCLLNSVWTTITPVCLSLSSSPPFLTILKWRGEGISARSFHGNAAWYMVEQITLTVCVCVSLHVCLYMCVCNICMLFHIMWQCGVSFDAAGGAFPCHQTRIHPN